MMAGRGEARPVAIRAATPVMRQEAREEVTRVVRQVVRWALLQRDAESRVTGARAMGAKVAVLRGRALCRARSESWAADRAGEARTGEEGQSERKTEAALLQDQ